MAELYRSSYWGSTTEDHLTAKFPLHRACRDGDLEALSLLLVEAQHGIYVEDSFYGWTPAHWAAYFGKLNCLMRLLESGIHCDVTSVRLSQTPAHLAAFGGNSHCLKWLLHCGAAINKKTPLHLAAFGGHPHCTGWLLEAAANIDKQDYLGETPIHKAARTGSRECASLLVSQGARLSVLNNSNQTPAQLASSCGFDECACFLEEATRHQQAQELEGTPSVASAAAVETSPCVNHRSNGVSLPPPAPSIPNGHSAVDAGHTEWEMEDDSPSQEDVAPALPGFQHGRAHLQNGHVVHHTDHHHTAFTGLSVVPHGDVTIHQGISANQVAVAGCKRAREDTVEEMECKRMRKNVVSDSWESREQFNFTSTVLALDYDDQEGFDYNGLPQFSDKPNSSCDGREAEDNVVQAAQSLECEWSPSKVEPSSKVQRPQTTTKCIDPGHGACPQDGFLAGDFIHHVRHPPDLFTRESSPIPPSFEVASSRDGDANSFLYQKSGRSPLPESVRSSLLQLAPKHVANGVVAYVQDALSSSAMEHHHSVMLEQGYDSMFCDAMAPSSLQRT